MLKASKAAQPFYRYRIGNREIVGPANPYPEYIERPMIPCPAIRYKPPSPEINALREKEKGSWKSLSIDEKRFLYRASFRQTFAEMDAPTAEGRRVFGNVLLFFCVPILIFTIMKSTVFPPLPESFSDLNKKLMVRHWIDARVGEMHELWDYENQKWRKKPFLLMKKD